MKKVGDEIACDEPLFEVSTDKVDSEVPSPAAGYLAEILVAEGADCRRRHQARSRHRRPCPRQASGRVAGRGGRRPRHRLWPAPSEPAPAATRSARAAGSPLSAQPEPGPAPSEEGEAGPIRARMGRGWCCLPSYVSSSPSTASTRLTVPGTRQGRPITRADVLAFHRLSRRRRRSAGG